jgi:WD40 repeat protein
MKLWDINTGEAVQTLFGHIEGVWAVVSDKLRLVSGSHDRTIKVGFHLFVSLFFNSEHIIYRYGLVKTVAARPLWPVTVVQLHVLPLVKIKLFRGVTTGI